MLSDGYQREHLFWEKDIMVHSFHILPSLNSVCKQWKGNESPALI